MLSDTLLRAYGAQATAFAIQSGVQGTRMAFDLLHVATLRVALVALGGSVGAVGAVVSVGDVLFHALRARRVYARAARHPPSFTERYVMFAMAYLRPDNAPLPRYTAGYAGAAVLAGPDRDDGPARSKRVSGAKSPSIGTSSNTPSRIRRVADRESFSRPSIVW